MRPWISKNNWFGIDFNSVNVFVDQIYTWRIKFSRISRTDLNGLIRSDPPVQQSNKNLIQTIQIGTQPKAQSTGMQDVAPDVQLGEDCSKIFVNQYTFIMAKFKWESGHWNNKNSTLEWNIQIWIQFKLQFGLINYYFNWLLILLKNIIRHNFEINLENLSIFWLTNGFDIAFLLNTIEGAITREWST